MSKTFKTRRVTTKDCKHALTELVKRITVKPTRSNKKKFLVLPFAKILSYDMLGNLCHVRNFALDSYNWKQQSKAKVDGNNRRQFSLLDHEKVMGVTVDNNETILEVEIIGVEKYV